MPNFKSQFWESVGVFVGMVIGSGMFALPYAVSVAGLWASVVGAAFAFFAVISVHFAYGEVVVSTEERHRLPGYVKAYLGKFAGNLNKIGQVVFFNATLLVYAVLGGVFLFTIFGGGESATFWWSLIFFAASSLVLYFATIEKIGFLNLILTIPLVAAILFISFWAFDKGGIANVPFYGSDPFFAFGVFVFALTGLSAIPDAYDVFSAKGAGLGQVRGAKNVDGKRLLKKVITLGTTIPFVLYAVFIVAVLMASNGFVSEDAISSLENVLGYRAVFFGAVAGFLAVFTSFLVLAYDLMQIYCLDLGVSKTRAWLLSALVPTALFLFGLTNFIKMISIVGGVFIALDGFFVILILRKIRQSRISKFKFLPFGPIHQFLLFLIFAASIIYEVVYQIF